jgi:hypothetical protein
MNIFKFIVRRFFKSKSQIIGAQFSQRPLETTTPSVPTEPDWWKDRLFCYWGDQTMLHFGSNRKKPVKVRRLITLKKRGIFWVVLPATGKAHSDFFCLYRTECICPDDEKLDSLYDKSYLCPRAETVPAEGLIEEIGVVDHLTAPEILEWYQKHQMSLSKCQEMKR